MDKDVDMNMHIKIMTLLSKNKFSIRQVMELKSLKTKTNNLIGLRLAVINIRFFSKEVLMEIEVIRKVLARRLSSPIKKIGDQGLTKTDLKNPVRDQDLERKYSHRWIHRTTAI